MNIKVGAKHLADKILRIEKVIEKSPSNPVLKNLKMVVSYGYMTVTAMNEKVCVTETISDEFVSDRNGEFLVDALTFMSFIKKNQKKGSLDILVDSTTNRMTISHNTGKFEIPVGSSSTYMTIFSPAGYDRKFSIGMGDIVGILNKASKYIMIDTFYPCIENVMISIDEDNINVVSTDRFTIYRYFKKNVDKIPVMDMPISNKSALILDSHIGKNSDDKIVINVDDRRTFFSLEGAFMYEVNFEGKYPNWRYVDSSFHADTKIVFDRNMLISSVNSLNGVNKFNHISFYATRGKSGMMAEDKEAGKSCKEYPPVISMEGMDVSCTMISERLMSILKSVSGDKVVMEHSSTNHFNKIYGQGNENEYFLMSSIIA